MIYAKQSDRPDHCLRGRVSADHSNDAGRLAPDAKGGLVPKCSKDRVGCCIHSFCAGWILHGKALKKS